MVVGAGVAGLRAAIELADAGSVLVISKQEITESNTQYAQGGVAVALSDEDEVSLHLQDTIRAGDGLVDERAAKLLVGDGPERIQELIDWDTQFDREGTRLTFTREAAHSRSRVLHAHGDSTGREIGRALAAKAGTLNSITVVEHAFTTDLLLNEAGECCGIELLVDQSKYRVRSRAVLLASGGAGQIYSDTTNPRVATGDGIAMAYRAGAEISDVEFFQFHPTALSVFGAPRFLLSEALRGEGALLLNPAHMRFMGRYHPMAELAPRDVVARAITQEIAVSQNGSATCFLDMRHLVASHVRERFPRIAQTCAAFGLDIGTDLIPVRPAAHYLMGGVRTDLDGRTSLPYLFGAGECACSGVHGANRLASNSLLEGLVFGARAGVAMKAGSSAREGNCAPSAISAVGGDSEWNNRRADLQRSMWQEAGLLRSRTSLETTGDVLHSIEKSLAAPSHRLAYETWNLMQVSQLLIRCALAREESRGAHYRTDFPERNDLTFQRHSVVSSGSPVTFA
ncbi:MAG: L-aspartate oxidase [Acidobacteriaceae bacterium]